MKKQTFLLLFVVAFGMGISSCSIVFSKTNDYTTNKSRQKKTRPANRPQIAKAPKEEIEKQEEAVRPSVTLSRAELELRNSIISKAKSLKNIPYLYGGKNKGGFDCSGLTKYVFDQHKIKISQASYAQAKNGIPIDLDKCRAGDLVFFGHGTVINHVALVVSANKYKLQVIHSTSSKGVIEEDILASNYWKPKVLFAKDIITQSIASR